MEFHTNYREGLIQGMGCEHATDPSQSLADAIVGSVHRPGRKLKKTGPRVGKSP